MLTLEESKNGAKVSVEAPKRAGFHDDVTDSTIIAINALSEKSKNGKTNAKSIGYGGQYSAAKGQSYNAYHMNKYKMHGMNDKRGLY
jgi:hypothetical protein